jgi:Curlin associated repeat.
MKKLIILSLALSLVLPVPPTMAAGDKNDTYFYAFSQMPTGERTALTEMQDSILASIEGGKDIITITINGRDVFSVRNRKVIRQIGRNNRVVIRQTGKNNIAVVRQAGGSTNSAIIRQKSP